MEGGAGARMETKEEGEGACRDTGTHLIQQGER